MYLRSKILLDLGVLAGEKSNLRLKLGIHVLMSAAISSSLEYGAQNSTRKKGMFSGTILFFYFEVLLLFSFKPVFAPPQ